MANYISFPCAGICIVGHFLVILFSLQITKVICSESLSRSDVLCNVLSAENVFIVHIYDEVFVASYSIDCLLNWITYPLNIIIHRWKEMNVATLRNYATLRWSKETKRRRRTRKRVEKRTITSYSPCCHISFTRQFGFLFGQLILIFFYHTLWRNRVFFEFICNSLLIIIYDSRHFCHFAAFDIFELKSGERIYLWHIICYRFFSIYRLVGLHCFSFFWFVDGFVVFFSSLFWIVEWKMQA